MHVVMGTLGIALEVIDGFMCDRGNRHSTGVERGDASSSLLGSPAPSLVRPLASVPASAAFALPSLNKFLKQVHVSGRFHMLPDAAR